MKTYAERRLAAAEQIVKQCCHGHYYISDFYLSCVEGQFKISDRHRGIYRELGDMVRIIRWEGQ